MKTVILVTKINSDEKIPQQALAPVHLPGPPLELPDDTITTQELENILPREAPDCYLVSAWPDLEDLAQKLGVLRLHSPHVAVFLACADAKFVKARLFPPTLVDGYLDREAPPKRFAEALERLLEQHRTKAEFRYLRRRDARGNEIGSMVAGWAAMKFELTLRSPSGSG
jgi:hypothetical protein